jgi:hypothetical protein
VRLVRIHSYGSKLLVLREEPELGAMMGPELGTALHGSTDLDAIESGQGKVKQHEIAPAADVGTSRGSYVAATQSSCSRVA